MAEGLARNLGHDSLEIYSAGLHPRGMHPMTVSVMDEIGIDIRKQSSKGIDLKLLNQMNFIITVCGNAEENCPLTPPHIYRDHWPIQDPVSMGETESQRLIFFRKTRDEIKKRVNNLFKNPFLNE